MESVQRYILNFLRHIFQIQRDLQNRTLVNGRTDEFTLRERGRIRPIKSLQTNDRVVRHAFCDELLMPAIIKKIIYDNAASVKGRGMAHARKRFEIHLRKYYREYGNEGYILLDSVYSS